MTTFQKPPIHSVCLFCGSASGRDPRYMKLAADFGKACATAAVRLVYGGARVGLMGAAAKAALEAGGSVLGIIPEQLTSVEIVLDEAEIEVTDTLAARKQRMFDQSDAFVVLPGGIGTLDEVVEIMSWARLGMHERPIVFLDDDDYWDGFFDLIEHHVTAGFTPPETHISMLRARTPRAALWQLGVRAPERA